jgi:hypothetical protein
MKAPWRVYTSPCLSSLPFEVPAAELAYRCSQAHGMGNAPDCESCVAPMCAGADACLAPTTACAAFTEAGELHSVLYADGELYDTALRDEVYRILPASR